MIDVTSLPEGYSIFFVGRYDPWRHTAPNLWYEKSADPLSEYLAILASGHSSVPALGRTCGEALNRALFKVEAMEQRRERHQLEPSLEQTEFLSDVLQRYGDEGARTLMRDWLRGIARHVDESSYEVIGFRMRNNVGTVYDDHVCALECTVRRKCS